VKTCTAKTPSGLLAAFAAGVPPAMPAPPAKAVRRHSLDDARPGTPASRPMSAATSDGAKTAAPAPTPREFTAADKAIIRRVHAYMSMQQLLGILNTRLAGDVGDRVAPYTLDQLRAEIAGTVGAVPAADDWAGLRKRLAKARRDGVLDQIDEQTIHDFAVVFSLNPRQMLSLKDILLQAEESEE
jgi:hypothetical protein